MTLTETSSTCRQANFFFTVYESVMLRRGEQDSFCPHVDVQKACVCVVSMITSSHLPKGPKQAPPLRWKDTKV